MPPPEARLAHQTLVFGVCDFPKGLVCSLRISRLRDPSHSKASVRATRQHKGYTVHDEYWIRGDHTRGKVHEPVVVGLLALLFATGCNQPRVQGNTRPWSRPSLPASEEFNLRGKCAALADDMAPTYGLVGVALTSQALSHYNPETNRCYVQIRVTKNFSYSYPSTPANYLSIAVYDGQTKELLVSASQKGDASSGINWTAQAFNDRYVTFDKASAEIDRLMQNRDSGQERSK